MSPSKIKEKSTSTLQYVSHNQQTLCGFETPFAQHLTSENRSVKLSKRIPLDKIVGNFNLQFKSAYGRPPISASVVIAIGTSKVIVGLCCPGYFPTINAAINM